MNLLTKWMFIAPLCDCRNWWIIWNAYMLCTS